MTTPTITISNERLVLFCQAAKAYINMNKEQKKRSLLDIYLEILLDSALKKVKKLDRQKDLMRIKLCKKSASKHIEYDKMGNYQFSEEANIELLGKFDALDEETVEVSSMIVPKGQYPEKNLSYDLLRAFRGIVIPDSPYFNDDGELKSAEQLQQMLDTENNILAEERKEIEKKSPEEETIDDN